MLGILEPTILRSLFIWMLCCVCTVLTEHSYVCPGRVSVLAIAPLCSVGSAACLDSAS
jgi:hypothetical protein